jgi:hypothetical protein
LNRKERKDAEEANRLSSLISADERELAVKSDVFSAFNI